LRREGRRKRKAGAKNEKAVLIIAPHPPRSRKNFTNIQRKQIFCKKLLFTGLKREKKLPICEK